MVIGTADMLTTKKITNTLKRKMIRQKSKFQPQKGATENLNVLTSSESSQSGSDDIFQPQSQASTSGVHVDKITATNRTVDYTLFSRTCDRCGVSDRATAVLHTSIWEIIDTNKLRWKRKIAQKLIAEEDKVLQIPVLYFDARKDKTLIISEKDRKM
ncbi:hypothetical protein AVEN_72743-1 [Araneus ventricosus]|uniref:Uncharacterized protein n=1 Tax=Araneus ventricosus TaxID=182803 RepID=A0A4Y2DRL5_ARAVE|nr:hypothetical protein AVEN_72743-1 [Araneus ventricosus]